MTNNNNYYWSIPSEAGPSTFPSTASTGSTISNTYAPTARRKRRRDRTTSEVGAKIGCLTTLFTATSSYALTPTRPYPPPNRPTRRSLRGRKRDVTAMEGKEQLEEAVMEDTPLVYPTSVTVPTDLPTETRTVDETSLPFYLTQREDGKWEKVDNAWRLYGREAGIRKDGVLIGSSDNNFAVESSLPKGWGQQSSRTDLYRVPLIVACSMILAIGMVIGIIILVFNRRKAHRKAKRKAERKRRKALQAAGIDPDGQDGRAQEAAFKEKLTELERQHRSNKRKDGNVGFSRIKVKRWTNTLRRRRGKEGVEGDSRPATPTIEVIEEQEEHPQISKPEDQQGRGEDTPSVNTINTITAGEATDTTDGLGPRTETEDSTRPTDTSPELSSDTHPTEPPAPYLPPEYRPASVRSYQMNDVGVGGSSRRRSSISGAVGSTDKTRAPGYYPAPATEDGEQALEVVSRAEGKRPLPPTDNEGEEERERVRHIATDDKRLLEQMRLGGSAPPRQSAEMEDISAIDDQAGPSAPDVEVDQDGFERHDHLFQEMSKSPSAPSHPDIPAPPVLVNQRSFGSPGPVNGSHLLPSAPPTVVESALPSAPPLPDSPLMPSAPPLDFEADEPGLSGDDPTTESSDHVAPIHLATPLSTPLDVPSAPPLDEHPSLHIDPGAEVVVGVGVGDVVREAEAADGELVSEQPHGDVEEPTRPRLFLPKYEP